MGLFGFGKKSTVDIKELLDRIEDAEARMRARGLYAALPMLDKVFTELDDTKLRITDEQKKSILVYVADVASADSIHYLEFIRYTCDEIIRLVKTGVTTDRLMREKNIEHRIKKCDAEIKSINERISTGGMTDLELVKLESELRQLSERRERAFAEYTNLKGDKNG